MNETEQLRKRYPLHFAVWHNDTSTLSSLLDADSSRTRLETIDARGRTPLMLAVTLGHADCARLLLAYNADANAENAGYWAVSHEAVCFGDPQLLATVLHHRDYQRAIRTAHAMARLLDKLNSTDDFYAEMSWEFSSWVPFVSKLCPSDTYKIYKRGASVRIDTTLIGFDSSSQWQRGHQSFIFQYTDNRVAQLIIIDHDKRQVLVQAMDSGVTTSSGDEIETRCRPENDPKFVDFKPTEEAIVTRLTSPVVTTYVDVDRIGFERSKGGGLLGWISRSERTETVAGYTCKVFNASNVDLVTKTRTEHMTESDKLHVQDDANSHPIGSILTFVERRETQQNDPETSNVYAGLTCEQYLDADFELNGGVDIGRPKQMSRRSNSFKATLWLCDDFPLSLQEQISPIIDLMAASNAHFARLNSFIQLQLPAGFPVKIEIPLFHVVSARITFANINARDRPVPSVHVDAISNRVDIDADVFVIPESYQIYNGDQMTVNTISNTGDRVQISDAMTQDDMYLQFFLQQNALNDGGNGINAGGGYDDYALQRAISESLHLNADDDDADELQRILEMSRFDEESRLMLIRQTEDDELQHAIQLSLIDK